jgi:nucleobase transporter 1/2
VSVPSYFQPYIVASHGPFHSKYAGVCHRVMFFTIMKSLNLLVSIFVIYICYSL